MTWLKIDDNFPEHPKVAALPNDKIRWFHVRAMAYAARFRTRGEITAAAFRQLGGKASYADALVEAALWDTTSRGGWAIHDFEVYNPTRDPQPELSAQRAAAGRLGGQRSGEAKREAKAEANLLFASEAPSRPVPSPTGSKEPELGATAPASRKKAIVELSEEERGKLLREFPGSEETIALALSHKSHLNYPTGQYLYVRNWLRNDRTRSNGNGTRANGNNGGDRSQSDPELIRLRALGIIHE